jgi:hypothetical protein
MIVVWSFLKFEIPANSKIVFISIFPLSILCLTLFRKPRDSFLCFSIHETFIWWSTFHLSRSCPNSIYRSRTKPFLEHIYLSFVYISINWKFTLRSHPFVIEYVFANYYTSNDIGKTILGYIGKAIKWNCILNIPMLIEHITLYLTLYL